MGHRRIGASLAAVTVVVAVLGLVAGASARPADSGFTNWTNFGNTVDQNRYSTLTQITPSNVGQLGRVFTADLNVFVPGIGKGQQSYPIALDGRVFVTSRDDQVFAVDGETGDAAVALRARQLRRVQELRGRRQPWCRLLRRQALPAHARHDHRLARSGDRQAARPRADRERSARARSRTTATRTRAHRFARITPS